MGRGGAAESGLDIERSKAALALAVWPGWPLFFLLGFGVMIYNYLLPARRTG